MSRGACMCLMSSSGSAAWHGHGRSPRTPAMGIPPNRELGFTEAKRKGRSCLYSMTARRPSSRLRGSVAHFLVGVLAAAPTASLKTALLRRALRGLGPVGGLGNSAGKGLLCTLARQSGRLRDCTRSWFTPPPCDQAAYASGHQETFRFPRDPLFKTLGADTH